MEAPYDAAVADLPLPVVAFSHVGISVADLDRSIDFYTGVLGFRVYADPRPGGHNRVLLGIDQVTLELFEGVVGPETMVPEPTEFPASKLALTVDDITEARETALAHGVELWGELFDTEVSWVFWIRDPDGNAIQLHEFKGGFSRLHEMFET